MAGTFLVFRNCWYVTDMGIRETSIISWSPAVIAGTVVGEGSRAAPRRMGMPSLRRRRVPRWKGFSLRDLAIWATNWPKM